MKTMIKKYFDPEQYKSEEFNQTFRSSCEGWDENSPESILTSMHLMFVRSCRNFVTPTEVQDIADHRTYLMRLFTRLQVENELIPEPGLYLEEFFVAYELLGESRRDVLNEDLDVYQRTFPSYEKAVRAFFKELETRASISIVADPCPLRAKILASFFKYSHIEAYASNLINQLTELTFIARTCAHSLYEGNLGSIEKYTNPIVGKVADISMHTAEFLNVSLISAWPSAHNQLLKEQIMRNVRKEGFVDDKSLKTVTEITRPLLMNTGVPNYAYEMLIVRATEKEYDLYFEGFDRYYSLRKNVSGFDTIIGRIPLNSTNSQDKLKIKGRMAHLNNLAYDLNATIQFEMGELYNDPSLPMIATELKKKIGTQVISRDNFHCWAILREWAPKFWSSCPTIDYFSSSYNVSDMSSITAVIVLSYYTILGTLGIVLNATLLYLSIFRSPSQIKTYRILIINFALTDMFSSFLMMFIAPR
ncbi:hypothetical protein GCK72_017729 [Caenorhabditis remanei]|uniref:G-protein coupled receptors family 1 profile domain-containing protein n=1 Tax=Caenorhabditis remanei TaxID=31234 RepID=A0A6A5G919_CAERE|nr:hypothetical protein GCK72_017729 [Caenorhabditis remanei]KAF1751175.1 hypothetical protein GCK72_017729 [Caenorhabditis remanei]